MSSKMRCAWPAAKHITVLLVVGGAIFGIVLAALIIVTGMALAGFLVHRKWTNSYVRSDSAVSSIAKRHLYFLDAQQSGCLQLLLKHVQHCLFSVMTHV